MEITVILKVIGVLFCCLLVFAAGCIAWWQIFEWGRREFKREDEYDELYTEIKERICFWPVTLVNHYRILSKINELKSLKHKDREKTSVLTNKFYWKYRGINKQRANKSVPEAVFKSEF